MFPRQSGKNELQAQLEAYLFCLFYLMNGEIVKVSPTWKTPNPERHAPAREGSGKESALEALLEQGIGLYLQGRHLPALFLQRAAEEQHRGRDCQSSARSRRSAGRSAGKIRQGHCAHGASTNATRVFWGTAWTSSTLLARELRACRKAEKEDGIKQPIMTANEVEEEVPAYGDFVDDQVRRLEDRP